MLTVVLYMYTRLDQLHDYTSTKLGLWDGSNNILERFRKTLCQKTPTKFHCIKKWVNKVYLGQSKTNRVIKRNHLGRPIILGRLKYLGMWAAFFWDGYTF
ncbi:hypothetical protein Hanom_Chr06g00575081 [Helianthus anomalus]